jgi:hypothetical protein
LGKIEGGSLETITDYPGKPAGHPIYGTKPCTHSKIKVTKQASFPLFESKGFLTPYSNWVKTMPPEGYYATNVPSSFGDSYNTEYQFQDRSMRSFANFVPRGVSLPNFILELGDLKSLAELAMRYARIAKSPKHLLKKLKRSSSENVKDLAKEAADLNLTYEFGIKPFINDLQDILNVTTNLQKRLKWLKRTKGKHVTTRNLSNKAFPDYQTGSMNWLPTGVAVSSSEFNVRTHYTGRKQTYVAGATMYHDLGPELEGFYSLLSAYTSYFGFDRPVEVIWEAIPFSFLVDWFLDLSYYAEQFQVQSAFSQRIKLTNPWFSVKRIQLITRDIEVVPWRFPGFIRFPNGDEGGFKETVFEAEHVSYARFNKLEGQVGLSLSTDLNEVQWRNFAALAVQRIS